MKIQLVVLPIAILLMLLALAVGISKLFLMGGLITQPFLSLLLPNHGQLMVFGFLSILLATERYLGALAFPFHPIIHSMPFLVAAGGIIQIAGWVTNLFPLVLGGSVILIAGFIIYIYIITSIGKRSAQPLPFKYMSLAAISLICASIVGIWNTPVGNLPFSMLLLGFPILTILGERVELTRFVAPSISSLARYGIWILAVAFALILIQTLFPLVAYRPLMLTWVLLLLAVAIPLAWGERRLMTRGEKILHRYLGVHLMAAYGWLFLGIIALLVIVFKGQTVSLMDAATHSLAIGFIGSMILAHAPIILPAILGRPLIEERLNRLPLWLLTTGNFFRVISELAGETGLRKAIASGVAGALTLLTVVVFVIVMLRSVQLSSGNRGSTR